MEALLALAVKYGLPFIVGVSGALSPYFYKLLAFKLAKTKVDSEVRKEERAAESEYRDSEWESLARLRDHFDKRFELLTKENEELRLRVRELEQQVDVLRSDLLKCETARIDLQRENMILKAIK
jgi:hypothetical protein